MTEPIILLRTGVPMVVTVCCAGALAILRERIEPPRRGFLIGFWGTIVLVLLDAAVVSLLFRLVEPSAMAAEHAGFYVVLGAIAALLLALTAVLARMMRVAGRPLLIALFRPPPDITYRALHGWPAVPVVTLLLATAIGAYAGTYALTSWLLALSGR